jgi:hypothetical protein
MKNLVFLIFTATFGLNIQALALFSLVEGIEAANIKRVAISPLEERLIFAASDNSLYRRDAASNSFKKIAGFKDEDIQHIFFDKRLANTVYIAASRNFYKMDKSLEKLFSVGDDEVILTASKHKGIFYLGTTRGLYNASEDLLNWKLVKGLSGAPVYSLDHSRDVTYVLWERGVYSLSGQGSAQPLFFRRGEEDENCLENCWGSGFIKVDIDNPDLIWLGDEDGIFASLDKGRHWDKFFVAGLDGLTIHSLLQTPLEKNTIYASTDRGFFAINITQRRGRQLFEGLHSLYINWAAFDAQGRVYIASDKGLFTSDYFTAAYQNSLLVREVIAKEPDIADVQKAAMRYNEVHPEKIRQWRKALYFRGLMPSLSLDYDKTIYGTAGGATYEGNSYVGPRDWGLSLSWNIGDLIWNTYQDDVDTRSRLNTQLRLDILDDINRVYFERLRLKNEISHSQFDEKELFQKQLRLAELTAILDGYTGGFFSQSAAELAGSN